MTSLASQRVCKSYRALVGLEIHVQLATRSKMFTGAANGFGGEPNSQVDAVVLGLPGVLPVMNKRAVEFSIKVGLALGCTIAKHTKWDRKSYYYPDLPKNYQISQYDLPLCYDGHFEIPSEAGTTLRVGIRRAHLEEDAGKLLHEAPGGYAISGSIVDLNRAGTPLLEIVTEPDLSSPKDVAAFGQELQKLVQFLGVSEGQMQMGHMRFEPNINVHITDQNGQVWKTAITEIKNLNSFSVLERATTYEIARQIREWEETGALGRKSTHGWDEATETTFMQRVKEEAQDYRYFPDPDLAPVQVDEQWLGEIKSQIGELPAARRLRYIAALPGVAAREIDTVAGDREIGDFFDAMTAAGAEPKQALILMTKLREVANENNVPMMKLGIRAARVAELARLIAEQKVAANNASVVLRGLKDKDQSAEEAARGAGVVLSSDSGAIDEAIEAMIAQNPKSLQDYKGGKQSALGSLVGMIMKNGKGLNARLVQERLKQRLG